MAGAQMEVSDLGKLTGTAPHQPLPVPQGWVPGEQRFRGGGVILWHNTSERGLFPGRKVEHRPRIL